MLGYVGLDNEGMSGIEHTLEKEIRGRAAKVVVHTDARRRPVAQTERPSTDGAAVTLTIDERIQHIAERELERAMAETQSQAGTVVVVEPFSGELLAMAGRPAFNPNRYNAYPSSRWRNRAVSDAFEPGSIFKIVTAAAGIQENVVTPGELIDCGNGRIEIAGTVINDHAVFDHLSFSDAVAHSSDIGMIRVAQRLGRENFARYVRDFGFGAPSGIELPGESAGLFRPTPRWSALSLPTLSFGQEIGVTALQITMAAAAVANGGYLMRPFVVKRVDDGEGRVLHETSPLVVRRVLEPQTVETLTAILQRVVSAGTGQRAALAGYVVAGKTGHRPEDRRVRPLLDGRPRGLVRGLGAGGAARAGGARLARHAARPEEPGRRRRGAAVRAGGGGSAARARGPAGRRRARAARRRGGPRQRDAGRVSSAQPGAAPARAPAGRARADARPARPSRPRGRDRRRAARAGGGASRLGPGGHAGPRAGRRDRARAHLRADARPGAARMKLAQLAARLQGAAITGDAELEITAVTHDSRRSGPGTLFVAIRGMVTDGNDFVEAARKKGAVAICSEQPPRGEATWVRVRNAREALALFSAPCSATPRARSTWWA